MPKRFKARSHHRSQELDPPADAVAAALAQALCSLARVDPRLSAAKPAGRLFATIILATCLWSVAAIFLLVDTQALTWAVMMLALCLNVFRLWACCVPEAPVSAHRKEDISGSEPIWTLLVALYQEAGSVGSLLNALDKLDWPKEKLDLVFACEADDIATLAALNHLRHRYCFRIIAVPNGGPRTKPKALQTALPFCRGRYLTVYDAEDLPASGQLREAWAAFRNGSANLAVVQAPLVIWNERESWISRQFALDYAIWFRLILPALVRISRFLPLGGTSNHFDINYLRDVGGWDPYNVTEDADLGARLARLGLTANLIHSPTYEEGAPTFAGWVRQRGRWIQGHIQTISVHLRTPRRLFLQLGSCGVLAFFFRPDHRPDECRNSICIGPNRMGPCDCGGIRTSTDLGVIHGLKPSDCWYSSRTTRWTKQPLDRLFFLAILSGLPDSCTVSSPVAHLSFAVDLGQNQAWCRS